MSMPRLEPAPARGHYDRSASSEQRQARQHERLLQATTHMLAEHGVETTIADVVAAARTGRNTFYEHFTDLDAAVEQVTTRAVTLLERALSDALADAWTPRERLRSALGAWVTYVDEHPFTARALLRLPSTETHSVLSRAGEPLRTTLRELLAEARRDAVISQSPDEVRLLAVTAAVEAIGRYRVEEPWSQKDAAAIAVDVVLRAFR